MTKALQVRNWEMNFENSESRKINRVSYVCMPNKHDGKGFARIAAHTKSCQVFTGWMLILQVASKMPQRGLLVDEDGALDVDDLAAMTRFKGDVFDIAIKALTDPKVNWLKWVEVPGELVCSGRGKDKIPINQDGIPAHPDVLGRTEQKGTEQNPPPKPPAEEEGGISKERMAEIEDEIERDALPRRPDEVPYREIVDSYNATLGSLLHLTQGPAKTTTRKPKMAQLWELLDCDMSKVKAYWNKVRKSRMLVGRKPDTVWYGKGTNFDWLINPDNAVKVIEGNYDNAKEVTGSSRSNLPMPKKLDVKEPDGWKERVPEHIAERGWDYLCQNDHDMVRRIEAGESFACAGVIDFEGAVRGVVE